MNKIMGVDYGDARTGIAISDLLCSIVGSTCVVPSRNTEKAIADIVKLAKDHMVGEIDILAYVDGEKTLIDIKTTAKYHKRNLEIQEGLYMKAIGEEVRCACAWIPRNGEAQYIEVNPISSEDVDKLVNAYQSHLEAPQSLEIRQDIQLYTPEEKTKIKQFYELKKEVEEIDKKVKSRILEQMKANDIKSFEDEDFKTTYIAPSVKTVVDTQKMKDDGIYSSYVKETTVKESVRITPRWLKAKEQEH